MTTTNDPAAPAPTSARSSADVAASARDALAAVRRHYPEAVTTDEAVHRLLDLLAEECGLAPSAVLLADSVCSDDVNSVEYPERARAMIGPFKLGGLDGFPHAGLTGMAAFAGHVPDGGGIVVYHAPHIGVSREGTLGMIRRPGQHALSGCCGAARAALARLEAGTLVAAPPSTLDYQQETIEQLFLQASDRILAAGEPLKEATEVMQDAIAERIDLLIARTRFPVRWVLRFGGVLVNGDGDMGSFSVVRRLLLTDQRSGTTRDLLAEGRA
jgi:hypothetical protein